MSYHAALTLIYFIAFMAMVFWVYRPSRKKDYDKLGHMALDAENPNKEGEQ